MGSLGCRIGWHRPRAGGLWNHGYCFTACDRCGRDMVRSAFGEWHVPQGFRVVSGGDAATIARFDAAMAARDAGSSADGTVAIAEIVAEVVASAAPAVEHPARPASAPVTTGVIPREPRMLTPRPAGVRRPAGSPFDFGDFDMVDPTAATVAGAPASPPSRSAI